MNITPRLPVGVGAAQILRDLSSLNDLINAVEGGAGALPRIARGDAGLTWTVDLGGFLARKAAEWGGAVTIGGATAAAGGNTASIEYHIPYDSLFHQIQVLVDTASSSADISWVEILAGGPPSPAGYYAPIFQWANGDPTYAVNLTSKVGYSELLINQLDVSARLALPLTVPAGTMFIVALHSTAGSAAAQTIKCRGFGAYLGQGYPTP